MTKYKLRNLHDDNQELEFETENDKQDPLTIGLELLGYSLVQVEEEDLEDLEDEEDEEDDTYNLGKLKCLSDLDCRILRDLIVKELESGSVDDYYTCKLENLLVCLLSPKDTIYCIFGFYPHELVDLADADPNKIEDLSDEDFIKIRDIARDQLDSEYLVSAIESATRGLQYG